MEEKKLYLVETKLKIFNKLTSVTSPSKMNNWNLLLKNPSDKTRKLNWDNLEEQKDNHDFEKNKKDIFNLDSLITPVD